VSAPIRVALVGAGAMGGHHARVLHLSRGARLAIVVDRHRDRAEKVAADTGCAATDRLEDALTCDAAIIATPADQHLEAALAFLLAGKPVLVEKPVAESLEDVRRLVDTSQRSGLPLMCGFVERFNPAVMTAATLLPEAPRHMVAERHSPPVPRIKTHIVHDLLIHDVDLAIHFMAGAGINQVRRRAEAGAPSPDAAGCHLGFAGGATARLSASRARQDRVRTFVIETASGRIELDLVRPRVFVQGPDGTRPTEIPILVNEEPLARQLQHFLALIDGRADVALERTRLFEPHRVTAQLVGA
jgi:predicted dehydrogenase